MAATALLFAELGRLARGAVVEFDEPVRNREVLRDLQAILESETGDLQRLFDVTLKGETFEGKAEQRISLGRSQTYQFTITPEQMIYRLVNGDEVARFAESDEGWVAIAEFAAKKGKKLNCKPGNVQCGGKCQNGAKNCFAGMTPDQKKAVQAAAKKAGKKQKELTPSQMRKLVPESVGNSRVYMVADGLAKGDFEGAKGQQNLRQIDIDTYLGHLAPLSDSNITAGANNGSIRHPVGNTSVDIAVDDYLQFSRQANRDAERIWNLADDDTKDEWARVLRGNRRNTQSAIARTMFDDLEQRWQRIEAAQAAQQTQRRSRQTRASNDDDDDDLSGLLN